MAKAALEIVNGVNLFGKHGAHWSVIFVDIDAHYRNRTTVDSILARESASKVVRRRRSIVLVGVVMCVVLHTIQLLIYLFCRRLCRVPVAVMSGMWQCAALHVVLKSDEIYSLYCRYFNSRSLCIC